MSSFKSWVLCEDNRFWRGSNGMYWFVTEGSPSAQKVVCGVCGAVRFYKYVMQARKFGVFSCESCRKFISRVIQSKFTILKCITGKGRHWVHYMPSFCITVIYCVLAYFEQPWWCSFGSWNCNCTIALSTLKLGYAGVVITFYFIKLDFS